MADVDPRPDPAALIRDMGTRARSAARALAGAPTAQKADALRCAGRAVREESDAILAANCADMEAARAASLAPAMLDRLMLDERDVSRRSRARWRRSPGSPILSSR